MNCRRPPAGSAAAIGSCSATRGSSTSPRGDFSLYDHVLDTAAMVGAIPQRFRAGSKAVDLATYFAMARGGPRGRAPGHDEMVRHQLPLPGAGVRGAAVVPAGLDRAGGCLQRGDGAWAFARGRCCWARSASSCLGKSKAAGVQPLGLLERLLPVYEEMIRRLARAGAEWVQIDEPVLALGPGGRGVSGRASRPTPNWPTSRRRSRSAWPPTSALCATTWP